MYWKLQNPLTKPAIADSTCLSPHICVCPYVHPEHTPSKCLRWALVYFSAWVVLTVECCVSQGLELLSFSFACCLPKRAARFGKNNLHWQRYIPHKKCTCSLAERADIFWLLAVKGELVKTIGQASGGLEKGQQHCNYAAVKQGFIKL